MPQRILTAGAVALTLIFAGGLAHADGDAAKGEKRFGQCKACHSLEEGKNKVGPTLHGLFGRQAGSVDGYKYSTDLAAAGEKGLKWDEELLSEYLEDPTAFLKKYLGKDKVHNKMKNKFRKEDFREDVIAYLKEATK